jgi:uncharacterized protein (TIGR02996 family)
MARRSTASAAVPRPEVLAFLADIKENPEDDTPRLVLADWLEERDDPRGEFIRLQCERARRDPDGEPKQHEKELLEKHRSEWLGPLAEKGIVADFERGLVQAWGRARKLLSKRLAKMPPTEALEWVDNLRLWDMDKAAVEMLAASPHWVRLPRLNLASHQYYADHLAGQWSAGMGPEGGVAMAALPQLSGVRELDLSCNDIGAAGVAALVARPDLGHLRVLDLGCNNLRNEGAKALASSKSLTGLSELYLNGNRMGAEGLAAVAGWPCLAQVTALRLYGNYFGPEGIAALAASPHLGNLTQLHLTADDNGARAPQLGPYQIGPKGAAALAASTRLPRLAILNLSHNAIGPEGARALAASRTLTALVELDLSQNGLGDAGAVALAKSRRMARLTHLDLRFNQIGDCGAKALAESPHLVNLRFLNFTANYEASPDAVAALRARFGDALHL